MSLQNIINLASELTVDHRPTTGNTITRSGIARAELVPNRQPWRFTLSVAPQPWYQVRSWLGNLQSLLYTPQVIKFNANPKFAWLFRWQGGPIAGITNIPAITLNSFTGTSMTITQTGGPFDPVVPDGTYLIRSGDLIQVGDNYPYPFMCLTDVLIPSPSVPGATYNITVHRPNFLTGITYPTSIQVGAGNYGIEFNLFCPRLPTYKLVPGAHRVGVINGIGGRDTINNAYVVWDSPFELVEWTGDI